MLTDEQMTDLRMHIFRGDPDLSAERETEALQRAYRMGLADAAKIVKENIGYYGERSQRAALYALSILEMRITAESVSEILRAEAGE